MKIILGECHSLHNTQVVLLNSLGISEEKETNIEPSEFMNGIKHLEGPISLHYDSVLDRYVILDPYDW